MPNLVITSTENSIRVEFNDYSSSIVPKKGTWTKNDVVNFTLAHNDEYVTAHTFQAPKWMWSFNGYSGMQIDTINGAAPTSNSDLYDKLIALIT